MRCAYRYWCEGSEETAVQLMVSLIKRLGGATRMCGICKGPASARLAADCIVLLRQGNGARANLCASGFLYRPT